MFEFVRQALNGLATEWRRQAAIRELNKLSDPCSRISVLRRGSIADARVGLGAARRSARLRHAPLIGRNSSLADEPSRSNTRSGVR